MPQGLTGITADTSSRRLLGEGMLYLNYGEVGERLLGAVTQGEFNPGITLARGDVAGAIGVLEGMDFIESCLPTLQATLLEVTAENLALMLPGGGVAAVGAGRAHVTAEWFGEGDDIVVAFALAQNFILSQAIYKDLGYGPVLMVEGALADYTIVDATGVVTFNAAPEAAYGGTSVSGLNPVLDMTAFPADVDGMVQVTGGVPTAVVFAWAGCTTGALTAAQIQAAIQALGGDFAAVTCVYVGAPPNDYYLITSGLTGANDFIICSNGAPNNAMDHLELGVMNGGTETLGGDDAQLTADYHYDPSDGVATHDTVTVEPIEMTDYVTNIAWLGRCNDNATEELIITILNALAIEMSPLTLEEKGNIGVQVTFRGSVTGAAPQAIPFSIRRPLPA